MKPNKPRLAMYWPCANIEDGSFRIGGGKHMISDGQAAQEFYSLFYFYLDVKGQEPIRSMNIAKRSRGGMCTVADNRDLANLAEIVDPPTGYA